MTGHEDHKSTIGSDHVYLWMPVPPKPSLSYGIKTLKGESAGHSREEYPELGMHIRSRRYFVSPVEISGAMTQNHVKDRAEGQIREAQLRFGRTIGNDIVRSCCVLNQP